MVFLVQWRCKNVKPDWELFFFIFAKENFNIIFTIFLLKRFCGRPSDYNFGHTLDRKQTFFKGGPINMLEISHAYYL